MKGIPGKQTKIQQESKWNRGKPGGWERYKDVANDAADQMKEVNETEINITDVMKKIDTIDTKIKFKTFGKTKQKKKTISEIKMYQLDRCNLGDSCHKCKSQKDKDESLLKKQRQRIEEEVYKITNSKQGRAGKVFKIRNSIIAMHWP